MKKGDIVDDLLVGIDVNLIACLEMCVAGALMTLLLVAVIDGSN